jgi:hypothetical protein
MLVLTLEAAQSMPRSGQNCLAQGLPWENPPHVLALKGATRYGKNPPGTSETDRLCISCPFSFRAKRLFSVNPGLSYFGHFRPRIGRKDKH